jgi:hypothetical protein
MQKKPTRPDAGLLETCVVSMALYFVWRIVYVGRNPPAPVDMDAALKPTPTRTKLPYEHIQPALGLPRPSIFVPRAPPRRLNLRHWGAFDPGGSARGDPDYLGGSSFYRGRVTWSQSRYGWRAYPDRFARFDNDRHYFFAPH